MLDLTMESFDHNPANAALFALPKDYKLKQMGGMDRPPRHGIGRRTGKDD